MFIYSPNIKFCNFLREKRNRRFELLTSYLEGRRSTAELIPQGGEVSPLSKLATCPLTGGKKPGGSNLHPHQPAYLMSIRRGQLRGVTSPTSIFKDSPCLGEELNPHVLLPQHHQSPRKDHD